MYDTIPAKSILDIEKSKNDTSEFQPNVKLLYRITRVIIENESIGKTILAQKANINYVILVKHLTWLEEKGLIETVIHDRKIHVRFREEGRAFAEQFTKVMTSILE